MEIEKVKVKVNIQATTSWWWWWLLPEQFSSGWCLIDRKSGMLRLICVTIPVESCLRLWYFCTLWWTILWTFWRKYFMRLNIYALTRNGIFSIIITFHTLTNLTYRMTIMWILMFTDGLGIVRGGTMILMYWRMTADSVNFEKSNKKF